MANEITLTLSADVTNGDFKETVPALRITRDQTTAGFSGGIQTIGTTEENFSFLADVATTGYLYLRNLDSTNFVEIGPDSTGLVNCLKMLAGDIAIFRLHSSATLRAKADTAAVKVQFWLLEE